MEAVNNVVNTATQTFNGLTDNVKQGVAAVRENVENTTGNIGDKIASAVPAPIANMGANLTEKAKSVEFSAPPLLKNVDSFRKNVLKIAVTLFLFFVTILFIMLRMGDNSMDFFKNPSVCPEGLDLNVDGDCEPVANTDVNCSGYTPPIISTSSLQYTIDNNNKLTKILADRNDEDIRKLIKECNLTWDGYSNNPDFMNDPIGAE